LCLCIIQKCHGTDIRNLWLLLNYIGLTIQLKQKYKDQGKAEKEMFHIHYIMQNYT